MTKLQIVERVVGDVQWSGDWGYCACPGEDLHTTKTGKRDCKIYTKGPATFYCFHSGCDTVRKEAQKKLRDAIWTAIKGGELPQEARIKSKKPALVDHGAALKRRTELMRDKIFEDFKWTAAAIEESSPVAVPVEPVDQCRRHLALFDPSDVVWIGQTFDSGQPEHVEHFRPVERWLKSDEPPANFICPNPFFAGSYKRSNAHVVGRRFLVVESDHLDRDTIGAVFWWMRKVLSMKLRAIISSGGKSLHAWFDAPTDEKRLAELSVVLQALHCDPAMFKVSQPVRLAGAWREDKNQIQRMMYYDN